jgi:bacillolysin
MTSARRLPGAAGGLALAAAIAALIAPVTLAQTALTNPGVRFAATQTDSLPSAEARVQSMLRDGELELAQVAADPLIEGRTHERLVQRYRGLPVFGGVLMRQMDRGFVRTIFGRIYPGINVSTQPAIDAATAIARAVAAVERPEALAGEAVLGILPTGRGDNVLAWALVVRSGVDVRDVSVNAVTGAVERNRTRLREQIPNIGIGKGVGGDDKKVPATASVQGFVATDHTRPGTLATFDFAGSLNRLNVFILNRLLFDADRAFDSDNTWTDGAVVDAHVHQGWTYDYYFKRFGRHGMDDRNLEVDTIVHPVSREDGDSVDSDTRRLYVNNAIYIGGGQLLFGDGDGVDFDYFSGAFDIVAHEYTHGVTEYSSNLDYVDEPGALNEAFSDIMGASAEFFFQPPGSGPRQADWLIGEDITRTPPPFIRSLSNPQSGGQPDHYSQRRFIGTDFDGGGVHYNSGIVNQAFYLAVAGGTNRVSGIRVTGIGQANIERMEKIFYRAFVFFLGPTSQFSDARAATLQAASELYGASGNDHAQLERAWTAVGVN